MKWPWRRSRQPSDCEPWDLQGRIARLERELGVAQATREERITYWARQYNRLQEQGLQLQVFGLADPVLHEKARQLRAEQQRAADEIAHELLSD